MVLKICLTIVAKQNQYLLQKTLPLIKLQSVDTNACSQQKNLGQSSAKISTQTNQKYVTTAISWHNGLWYKFLKATSSYFYTLLDVTNLKVHCTFVVEPPRYPSVRFLFKEYYNGEERSRYPVEIPYPCLPPILE